MPVVELTENDILPERDAYDVSIESDPTMGEVVKAYANTSFVGQMINKYAHPADGPDDDDYDVFDDIQGYEGYADEFVGVESRVAADRVKANIDAINEAKSVMASGSLAEGLVGGIVTAPLSPSSYVPIAGEFAMAGKGVSILNRALIGAGSTGLAAAGEEALMQQLDPTRTQEETVMNVVSATALGGAVGGVGGAFAKRAQTTAAMKAADKIAANEGSTVGAAAADALTLHDEQLKSAFGLEKALAFQDPTLRMANSPSKTTRQLNEALAEMTLVKNKNTQGIASTVSVENKIKSYEVPKYMYTKERDRLFLDYRQKASKLATEVGDMVFKTARKDGKLTYNEFKEEVVRAGRRGDKHDIPQVAEAARIKREILTNPIFEESKAVGLIDEDVSTPGTAESYVNRVWDKQKIENNRADFQKKNAEWLRTKRDKAAADVDRVFETFDLDNGPIAEVFKQERNALKGAAKDTRAMERKVSKTGERIEKKSISIDEAQSQISEATRSQQRLYEKILKGRDRGDDDLTDLFHEFRSVSSRKQELYRRLTAKEGQLAEYSVKMERRAALADMLAKNEKELADKVDRLERELKDISRLQYKASFDDAELDNVAYQLTDRILGSPVGRLSYDNKLPSGKSGSAAGKRGPAKARVYDIPDEMIEDYLVNDDDVLTNSYVRSLASDIELHRTFGSIDPEDTLKKIQDDYARLENGVTDPATLRKLREAKNNDMRDFKAVWERLRGTYGNSGGDDYASGWKSAERIAMNMNFVAKLGGMTVSAFTDIARPIMIHGIQTVYGDGFAAFANDFKSFMAATNDVKEAGTALDMVLHTRGKALTGLDEFTPITNRVEEVTGKMANSYSLITLMAPWNAAAKQFSGVITQSRMLRSIGKIAAGKDVKPKEIEYLAANFIDAKMASRISEQFKKYGKKTNRVMIPNARDWDDLEAQKIFRAAVRRDVDRTIVTVGQDKPLWMSKAGLKSLGQFRSFSVASTQRTLLAGLQQRDAAALNGALLSVALGSAAYVLKSKASGYDVDLSPSNLIIEGVDRSGLLGWLADAANMTEKVTRGRVGVHALAGGGVASRYSSRSTAEALFGPTYGSALDIMQLTGNAFAGDWKAADTHTARGLLPGNNLIYIDRLVDEAEHNVNQFFGIKERKR